MITVGFVIFLALIFGYTPDVANFFPLIRHFITFYPLSFTHIYPWLVSVVGWTVI